MTLRKRLFIILGIIAAMILVILLLFFAFNKRNGEASTPAPTQNTPPLVGEGGGVSTPPPTQSPVPVGDPEEIYLKQLSRIFVERYGSFSNQNDNAHIVDILRLGTARMQEYLNGKRQTFDTAYHGMTTHVVASRILDKSAVSASVRVDVQRIVSEGAAQKTEYDSAKVALVKEGNEWKVDGVYWGQP